jgi:hypothetical protein
MAGLYVQGTCLYYLKPSSQVAPGLASLCWYPTTLDSSSGIIIVKIGEGDLEKQRAQLKLGLHNRQEPIGRYQLRHHLRPNE